MTRAYRSNQYWYHKLYWKKYCIFPLFLTHANKKRRTSTTKIVNNLKKFNHYEMMINLWIIKLGAELFPICRLSPSRNKNDLWFRLKYTMYIYERRISLCWQLQFFIKKETINFYSKITSSWLQLKIELNFCYRFWHILILLPSIATIWVSTR